MDTTHKVCLARERERKSVEEWVMLHISSVDGNVRVARNIQPAVLGVGWSAARRRSVRVEGQIDMCAQGAANG